MWCHGVFRFLVNCNCYLNKANETKKVLQQSYQNYNSLFIWCICMCVSVCELAWENHRVVSSHAEIENVCRTGSMLLCWSILNPLNIDDLLPSIQWIIFLQLELYDVIETSSIDWKICGIGRSIWMHMFISNVYVVYQCCLYMQWFGTYKYIWLKNFNKFTFWGICPELVIYFIIYAAYVYPGFINFIKFSFFVGNEGLTM